MPRPADPAHVKMAKGNPGKRPVADQPEEQESQEPAKSQAAEEPGWLTADGLRVWRSLGPDLERMRFLRPTDREAFARYCHNLAEYRKAVKDLRTQGYSYITDNGYHRQTGAAVRCAQLERILESAEDRFGLSPRARQQIMIAMAARPAAPPPAHPAQPGDKPDSEAPPLSDPSGQTDLVGFLAAQQPSGNA